MVDMDEEKEIGYCEIKQIQQVRVEWQAVFGRKRLTFLPGVDHYIVCVKLIFL
jgi:hypothetical protein